MYRRFPQLAALISAFLALAALAGGCGGSSDTKASASPAKPDFIKQAEAICRRELKKRDAIAEKNAEIGTKMEQKDRLRRLLPPFEAIAAEVDKLTPPAGDEHEIEQIVNSLTRTLAGLQKDPSRMVAGFPFEKYDTQVRKYGLAACSI